MRVAIVDHGQCNIDSIARAVEDCGGTVIRATQADHLSHAGSIVLPGVGAFGNAMRALRQNGLDVAMARKVLEEKTPLLGICLGMHMLTRGSEESEGVPGLGWIDADVRRLVPTLATERVPHVGWNTVDLSRDAALFDGIAKDRDFYFVHSYHVVPGSQDTVLGTTAFCGRFVSAVSRDNIFGVQFHPEKSQKAGFQLLRNFLGL